MPKTRSKESTTSIGKRKRTESDDEGGTSKGKISRKRASPSRTKTKVKKEVECILGDRKIKRKLQFRVRWKGYPEKEDSWEDEKNLDCSVFVSSYLDAKKRKLLEEKEQKSKSEHKPKNVLTNIDTKETVAVKLHARKQQKSASSVQEPEYARKDTNEKTTAMSTGECSHARHLKSDTTAPEVQCILDDRKVKGKRKFKVRWKEYPEKIDTWEYENKLDCKVLISSYLETKKLLHEKQQKSTTSDEPKDVKPSLATNVAAAVKLPAGKQQKSTASERETKYVKTYRKKKKEGIDTGQSTHSRHSESDTTTREVKQILDHSYINKVDKFKVRWKGYPEIVDTWVERKSLSKNTPFKPYARAVKAYAVVAKIRQKSLEEQRILAQKVLCESEEVPENLIGIRTYSRKGRGSNIVAGDKSDTTPVEIERSVMAYDQASIVCQYEEYPDDFYKHTPSERKIIREGPPPLDKRDSKKTNEAKQVCPPVKTYSQAVIRITFPDQIVLQSTFCPTEKVQAVVRFARDALAITDMTFYLFTAPPKVILDLDKTLSEVNCVPRARLYFGTDTPLPSGVPYLKQEVLKRLSSIDAATVAACKLSEVSDEPQPSTSYS